MILGCTATWGHLIESMQGLTGGFPDGSDSRESAYNAGDLCSITGSGRSPRERNSYPLHCSCLENSMDRIWQATYSPWGHKELDTLSEFHFFTSRSHYFSLLLSSNSQNWSQRFFWLQGKFLYSYSFNKHFSVPFVPRTHNPDPIISLPTGI